MKSRGELRCPRRVSSSYSCSGTCRLTDFVRLYTYEFWLSLCKIVRSSVILLLPLFTLVTNPMESSECGKSTLLLLWWWYNHYTLSCYNTVVYGWRFYFASIGKQALLSTFIDWNIYIYMCSNMYFNNHRKAFFLLSLILY